MKSKKQIINEKKKKIYCSNRTCPYIECVRYYKNIPYNVLILRENYKLDINGDCSYKLLDWKEGN